MKRALHRISFVLTWLCVPGLVCGMIYEARTHVLIFEGYIGTFFGWAGIFGIINYFTRLKTPANTTAASDSR